MNSKNRIAQDYCNLVIEKRTTKLTVKEICNYCHISRTTFYKYFKDTYEIIEYIFVQDCVEPQKNLIGTELKPKIIVLEWYLSFYKHKEFYLIAIHDEGQNSFFETIISRLEIFNKDLYSRTLSNKASQEDISYIAYRFASMQAMLLKKWIKEGMKVSPEKMTEYFLFNAESEHFY